MFTKLFTVAALAAAVLAVPTGDSNKCNVGTVQCCNSVQQANSKAVQGLASIDSAISAALAAAPVTAPVGITCSPIDIAAIGGNSCSAQPVCCENNKFSGVVAIGCTPINMSM